MQGLLGYIGDNEKLCKEAIMIADEMIRQLDTRKNISDNESKN